MTNNHIIYIGKKPIMVYVMSAVMELASSSNAIIQTRGNSISTAVAVSHVLLRKTNNAYKISDVTLGEDEMEQEDEKKKNVSTIQIVIDKKSSEKDSSENESNQNKLSKNQNDE